MAPAPAGFPRIYASPDDGPDPHALAARELLRPPAPPRGGRELDPFSRAWFEEIELKRYARHGYWLPRGLEFTRHPGESLVMLGPGLGTDALQYLRHGTRVTVVTGPADVPDLLRRNFEFRGADPDLVRLAPGDAFPFPRGAFDLAYLNALHDDFDPAHVAELYRVLKPGGKLLALVPARYDAGFWQDKLVPLQRLYWRRPDDPTAAAKWTARGLRRSLAPFADVRVGKRHLRRSELPHAWRFLPLNLLERLLGRVLLVRAFKPLAAAREAVIAAA